MELNRRNIMQKTSTVIDKKVKEVEEERIVYKSRWGWHPCDYETFKKLKVLNHACFKAIKRNARWRRWKRKDPHNRIIRKKIKNSTGQTIGYKVIGPWLEPELCPVFSKKEKFKVHFDKNGKLYRDGFLDDFVDLIKIGYFIRTSYANARKPEQLKENVKELKVSIDDINKLYQDVIKLNI